MKISKVWFDKEKIFIATEEGKEGSMPLKWFPRLERATDQQRKSYTFSPFGIHWEELDEDLSFEGFFNFRKGHVKA